MSRLTSKTLTRAAQRLSEPLSNPRKPKRIKEPLIFTQSKLVAKNRLYRNALSERFGHFDPKDVTSSGIPTKAFQNVYEKWIAGGYGLISTGAIIVDEDTIRHEGNMVVREGHDCEERRKGFEALAELARNGDTLLVAQLAALHDQKVYFIDSENDNFSSSRYASRYLQDRGFHGVHVQVTEVPPGPAGPGKAVDMIHGHGEAIRNSLDHSVPFIVGFKLNTAYMQQLGLKFDQILDLIAAAQKSGTYDFVEIAGGSYELPVMGAEARENMFRRVVHRAKQACKNTAVYVSGGMRTVAIMEDLIDTVTLDGVGVGRPACDEFDFGTKILSGHCHSALINPYEDDMDTATLAAMAQIKRASLRSLKESGGDVNDGLLNFQDPRVQEKFAQAKTEYMLKAAAFAMAKDPQMLVEI
uniref:Aldolase n=1 Tax=Panagrellus redivivus TaxID=6233 RepID=A0A7E4W4T7_PANRE